MSGRDRDNDLLDRGVVAPCEQCVEHVCERIPKSVLGALFEIGNHGCRLFQANVVVDTYSIVDTTQYEL